MERPMKGYTIKHDKIRNLVGLLIECEDKNGVFYVSDELSPEDAIDFAVKLISNAENAKLVE
jgi:hypothetical protein